MAEQAAKRETRRLGTADVEEAGQILRGGGTVAIPTETVYGLGANALDPVAVEKIFEAKGRPHWDPLIVHVSDEAMLNAVVRAVPEAARKLMNAFWPGPLTLLLERSSLIADVVTAGRPLVGVRMPAHPIARAVIAAAGVPIAAPSANRFGHVSPTRGSHVLADLDGQIDAVLDAGPCEVGVESTVLDATQSPMVMYRPGAVTLADVERVAGPAVLYVAPESSTEPESLPSPGVGIRHYAPRARVVLVKDEDGMRRAVEELLPKHVAALLARGWSSVEGAEVLAWEALDDTQALARTLFERLRDADSRGVDAIVVPLPPHGDDDLSAALHDRLQKAARVR